LFYFQAQKKRC